MTDGAGQMAGRAAPTRAAPPVLTVEAATIGPSDTRTVVEVAGVLEPVRSVVIGAEVAGRVVSIEVEEHVPVAEGDTLVRLDQALPRAAVERARGALLRAEATHELARSELKRRRDLAGQGVASLAELDRAESEERSGGAQVVEARAALLDAETRLEKTRIIAPFSGIVSALDLEPGAYLRPGDRVAELSDLSEIEVEVGVSGQEILALTDGDPVRLSVDAMRGRWFEGHVVRPGRTADPQTRRFPVPVRVPNPDGVLLPGMLGTVRFELGESRPSLRIPSRAVQSEFELEYVYILEPAAGENAVAVARRQRVRTRSLPFRPEQLEVTDGLVGGESIAVSGLRELRDGLRVRTRQQPGRVAEAASE